MGSPEFLESLNFRVQSLLVSEVPSSQLNGVDDQCVIGPREVIGRHIDAFFVLDDEVECQGQLLELSESFVSGKIRASLQGFVVGEEDKLLSSQMVLKVVGSPDHGSHFQ